MATDFVAGEDAVGEHTAAGHRHRASASGIGRLFSQRNRRSPSVNTASAARLALDKQAFGLHNRGMSVTTRIGVNGMTCGHCERAVTSELTALPGVSAVDIDLVKGGTSIVTVTSAQPLNQDQVSAALTEEGYEMASMAIVDTEQVVQPAQADQQVVPDGLAPAPSGNTATEGASHGGCGCGCKGGGRGGQGVGLPIVAAG